MFVLLRDLKSQGDLTCVIVCTEADKIFENFIRHEIVPKRRPLQNLLNLVMD